MTLGRIVSCALSLYQIESEIRHMESVSFQIVVVLLAFLFLAWNRGKPPLFLKFTFSCLNIMVLILAFKYSDSCLHIICVMKMWGPRLAAFYRTPILNAELWFLCRVQTQAFATQFCVLISTTQTALCFRYNRLTVSCSLHFFAKMDSSRGFVIYSIEHPCTHLHAINIFKSASVIEAW